MEIAKLANDKIRADTLLRNWIAAHPTDQGMRLEYAGFLLQQGENAKAASQYQTVLKQNPDSILALNNLGWLLQQGEPKRALSMLTHAWTLAPNSATVADTFGWLKVQQKDAAAGLALLGRAHALEPGDDRSPTISPSRWTRTQKEMLRGGCSNPCWPADRYSKIARQRCSYLQIGTESLATRPNTGGLPKPSQTRCCSAWISPRI